MTYTRTWSDVTPPDTDLAKNIGVDIRNLRQDVHDRMNTLVVDWTTDPIVPQPQILGSVTGKFAYIAGQQMNWSTQNNYSTSFGQWPAFYSPTQGLVVSSPSNVGATPPLIFGQFILPNNVTVTQFGVTSGPVFNAGGASANLFAFNTSILTATNIATCGFNGPNQFAKSPVFSQATGTNIILFFEISAGTSGTNIQYSVFYAFCLYNTPDSRSTI